MQSFDMFGPFHLVVLDVAQEHEALLPLGLGHGEHLLLKFLLMAPMLRLYCCVMAAMSTNLNPNIHHKHVNRFSALPIATFELV